MRVSYKHTMTALKLLMNTPWCRRGVQTLMSRNMPYPNKALSSPHNKKLTGFGRCSSSNSCQFPTELSRDNIDTFLGSFDTMFTDCDGVFWGCDLLEEFDDIPETIDSLRSMGTKLLFVSNNSLLDRAAYKKKFNNFVGFDADVDDIFVVTYATAVYMKEILNIQKCYMLGTPGLRNELELADITVTGYGPDTDAPSFKPNDILNMKLQADISAVVVGYDAHFHHNKLIKAASYLRNPNIAFIATNDLEMCVNLGNTHKQPVTGTFVLAVAAASERSPIVIGKPHKHLMDCILSKHPYVDLDRSIMVGDSLKTDIGFANTVGIPSLLVLSGSSSYDDLKQAYENNQILPQYYTENFSDLWELTR